MVDWEQYWDHKVGEDELESMGRGGASVSELFIYINSICHVFGNICDDDVILDLGGGAGYVSMALSPFVKSISLADFSDEMIKKASNQTSQFKNINTLSDSLPNIENIKSQKLVFSKILVGSVLQYLEDYNEIKDSFLSLYSICENKGKVLLTHNPDLTRKKSFIESYNHLKWPKEKINEAIEFEKKERFWMDYNMLEKIALTVGFSKCKKLEIPASLFQSSHMFDLLLIK